MTDGEFNTYRSWKNRDRQTEADRAKRLCAAMKAKGIEIYTVGFALDELEANKRDIATDMLQSCGSSLDHFYNTLNIEELMQAFTTISMQMSTVRLFTPPPASGATDETPDNAEETDNAAENEANS